jgi:hypothetical protein
VADQQQRNLTAARAFYDAAGPSSTDEQRRAHFAAGSVWHARAAGPIPQPGRTLGTEAGNLPVRALAGNPELLRDVGDRTRVNQDPTHQQGAAMNRPAGVSVRDEGLR